MYMVCRGGAHRQGRGCSSGDGLRVSAGHEFPGRHRRDRARKLESRTRRRPGSCFARFGRSSSRDPGLLAGRAGVAPRWRCTRRRSEAAADRNDRRVALSPSIFGIVWSVPKGFPVSIDLATYPPQPSCPGSGHLWPGDVRRLFLRCFFDEVVFSVFEL